MTAVLVVIALLLCITQPLLLLGFAFCALVMVGLKRPISWKDAGTAVAVGVLAAGLAAWNGDWDRIAAGYDSTQQEP